MNCDPGNLAGAPPAGLAGRTAFVVGIANAQSIAHGCAAAFRAAGARLAVTYLNDKAERHVRPLAEALEAELILPLDVSDAGQMAAAFDQVQARFGGRLDILLHSIAWCPLEDLHGRVVDCSASGFAQAMDISCHSFLRMLKLAEPLMAGHGGTALTVSYLGAQRVVPQYTVMGPVKAALEAAVRAAAHELGPAGIRVHALSPGPMATRAAGGIADFPQLLDQAQREAPLRRLATPEDVGAVAAFLASDGARGLTGGIHMIDCGQSILA